MKQVLIDGTGDLFIEEVPVPTLNQYSLLLKTAYSLIGSVAEADLAKHKGSILRRVFREPAILRKIYERIKTDGIQFTAKLAKERISQWSCPGFCSSGVVIEVGQKVKEFKVGDRVACTAIEYANHAEYLLVPEGLAVKIPENVSFQDACFAGIGAVVKQGLSEAKLDSGTTVAVIGLGLEGQVACRLLRLSGCKVVGIDSRKGLFDFCESYVDRTVLIGEDNPVSACLDYTLGTGLDGVIICDAIPVKNLGHIATQIVRHKGWISKIGQIAMDPSITDYTEKELNLYDSEPSYQTERYDPRYEEEGRDDYAFAELHSNKNRKANEFFDLISRGKIEISSLITRRFRIDDAKKAYMTFLSEEKSKLAVLFDYGIEDTQGESPLLDRSVVLKSPLLSPRNVRIAVVGRGDQARDFHLPNLEKIQSFYIGAIVGSSGPAIKHLARRFNADYCTTNIEEVLTDHNIDGVVICNRNHKHVPMAVRSAKEKKHIFLEKPIALNYTDLKELVKAVRQSQINFTVGFNRRFSPLSLEAKKVLDRLDGPTMINYRANAGMPQVHWYTDPVEGGGRIVADACHWFDLSHWFIGSEPVSLCAETISSNLPQRINDENIHIIVKFRDGSLTTLQHTSLGNQLIPKERIEIFKGETVIIIENFQKLLIKGIIDRSVKLPAVDKGHFIQMREWGKDIEGQATGSIKLEDGIRATICTFKVFDSLKSGTWVPIDLQGYL